jgi:hypothetical protein
MGNDNSRSPQPQSTTSIAASTKVLNPEVAQSPDELKNHASKNEEFAGFVEVKRFTSTETSELPASAIVICGEAKSGKTLLCRQWLRTNIPENKFPLTRTEIDVLDYDDGTFPDMINEVLRCGWLGGGIRSENCLQEPTRSRFKFLERNSGEFTRLDKGLVFKEIEDNRKQVIEALKVLRTDVIFNRIFEQHPDRISRNLLQDMDNGIQRISTGEKMKTVTAEQLARQGWNPSRGRPPFAWEFQGEGLDLFSLIETNFPMDENLLNFCELSYVWCVWNHSP